MRRQQVIRTRLRRAGVALAAVLAAGCIVQTPLAVPSDSGGHWSELKSKHFTLVTDLDAEDADAVLRTFERTYGLLAKVLFAGEAAPDFRTQVLAFRTERELREFLPPPFTGRYMRRLPNDIQSEPTVVMQGRPSPSTRILLAHELTHRFIHVAFQALPVWLNEGLAQYYSTVRGDVGQPVVGELDPDNGFASGNVRFDANHIVFQGGLIEVGKVPRPSALMRLEHGQFYVHRADQADRRSVKMDAEIAQNYAGAWALAHMLMQSSDRGGDLRRAVETPADRRGLADALRALDRTASDVDREFDAYLRKPIRWRQHHEGPPPAVADISRRTLADAEVLSWWTRLDAFNGPSGQRASQRLEAGAARSPENPDFEYLRGRRDVLANKLRDGERHLQNALARRPGDAGYLLALALLYLDKKSSVVWPPAELSKLLADAIERLGKVAQTPSELNTVAIYHLTQTTTAQGFPFAERAARADPACWSCLHSFAAAQFAMGRASEAAALEQRAIDRLPEDAPPRIVGVLVRDRGRYTGATSGREARDNQGTTLFLPD
jgi:hypothetical protein